MIPFFNVSDIARINLNDLSGMLRSGLKFDESTIQGRYIKAFLNSEAMLKDKEINTTDRLAHFLAQGVYETGFLSRAVENMYYSTPERLMQVWPSRFRTREAAEPYARDPEKLANKVYANRLGNGDEGSGDGYRYRGRGFFQLTGKDNYDRYGDMAGIDLVNDPELIERDFEKSIEVAAAFFQKTGLLKFADENNVAAVSRGVNRGNPHASSPAHGENERADWTAAAYELIRDYQDVVLPHPFVADPTGVKRPQRGDAVKDVQQKLIALDYLSPPADGVFGKITEGAVLTFQRDQGLQQHGVVDATTMAAMDAMLEEPTRILPPDTETAEDVLEDAILKVHDTSTTGAINPDLEEHDLPGRVPDEDIATAADIVEEDKKRGVGLPEGLGILGSGAAVIAAGTGALDPVDDSLNEATESAIADSGAPIPAPSSNDGVSVLTIGLGTIILVLALIFVVRRLKG